MCPQCGEEAYPIEATDTHYLFYCPCGTWFSETVQGQWALGEVTA